MLNSQVKNAPIPSSRQEAVFLSVSPRHVKTRRHFSFLDTKHGNQDLVGDPRYLGPRSPSTLICFPLVHTSQQILPDKRLATNNQRPLPASHRIQLPSLPRLLATGSSQCSISANHHRSVPQCLTWPAKHPALRCFSGQAKTGIATRSAGGMRSPLHRSLRLMANPSSELAVVSSASHANDSKSHAANTRVPGSSLG